MSRDRDRDADDIGVVKAVLIQVGIRPEVHEALEDGALDRALVREMGADAYKREFEKFLARHCEKVIHGDYL